MGRFLQAGQATQGLNESVPKAESRGQFGHLHPHHCTRHTAGLQVTGPLKVIFPLHSLFIPRTYQSPATKQTF